VAAPRVDFYVLAASGGDARLRLACRAAPRVDFYVLAASGGDARLRLACRLVEKAWQARQPVLVHTTDEALLARFDDLLWTFADGSFVPHERVPPGSEDPPTAPVLLSSGLAAAAPRELLLNLDAGIPAFAAEFARIIEVLDDDARTRELGRERFRGYRRLGVEPATHPVNAAEPGAAAPL
jgi:DNA polymerase III subunit chi